MVLSPSSSPSWCLNSRFPMATASPASARCSPPSASTTFLLLHGNLLAEPSSPRSSNRRSRHRNPLRQPHLPLLPVPPALLHLLPPGKRDRLLLRRTLRRVHGGHWLQLSSAAHRHRQSSEENWSKIEKADIAIQRKHYFSLLLYVIAIPLAFHHSHIALGVIGLVTIVWIYPTASVPSCEEHQPERI